MSDNRKFFDIKHPGSKSPTPRIIKVPVLPYMSFAKRQEQPPKPSFKMPLIAALLVFVSVIGIFGFNIFRFRQKALGTAPVVYDKFKAGASALLNFELGEAKKAFEETSGELKILNSEAPIKTLPGVLENLFKLSQNAASLSGTLQELKTNGLALMINKKGAFLIRHFKNIRDRLGEINILSGFLKSQAGKLGYKVDEDFSVVSSHLGEADGFLASLINWLETPKKQRLLVFFQNSSEIRPAGGFIGSYGHATLFQGNLLDFEVRDIYDPDGQLELKIIPPKPLQGVTDKWGARDANWFFDFPISAKKVIEFLEASKIYSEQGIKFGGAVAINVEVLKDILEIIGPVPLPEYQIIINSENFLPEVQREVEAGEDKTKGEPKKILKVLTPLIFEKLSNLKENQKDELVKKLNKRFTEKDIMVYFKDKEIQKYLVSSGVAGEVYPLPEGFTGEYLAVVNSNVAGGKSDAMIDQKIIFESRVDKLGRIKNKVIVERTHNGKDQKDWWYRSTNRNYLQIFTTPGSEISKLRGETKKIIKPMVDYKTGNYSKDDVLDFFERSVLAFGKTVFANWLEVKAGTTGRLEADYSSPSKINLASGHYQFIFEKQSGVNTSLQVSIEAPAGYQWKESQSPIFNYSGRDLPSRIVLNLTPVANQP